MTLYTGHQEDIQANEIDAERISFEAGISVGKILNDLIGLAQDLGENGFCDLCEMNNVDRLQWLKKELDYIVFKAKENI
jgi:hypothetical protein